MSTYTVNTGRRGILCPAAYSDLHERHVAASQAYADADDQGRTGTDAARTYRVELDAIDAEYARRVRSFLSAAFGIAS